MHVDAYRRPGLGRQWGTTGSPLHRLCAVCTLHAVQGTQYLLCPSPHRVFILLKLDYLEHLSHPVLPSCSVKLPASPLEVSEPGNSHHTRLSCSLHRQTIAAELDSLQSRAYLESSYAVAIYDFAEMEKRRVYDMHADVVNATLNLDFVLETASKCTLNPPVPRFVTGSVCRPSSGTISLAGRAPTPRQRRRQTDHADLHARVSMDEKDGKSVFFYACLTTFEVSYIHIAQCVPRLNCADSHFV